MSISNTQSVTQDLSALGVSHSASTNELTRKRKKKEKREKKHKSHKHKHHHVREEEPVPNVYDSCAGVVRVILSDNIQQLLKCVVGENVTAEKAWTYINKFFIQEQIESDDIPEDYTSFLAHKQAIIDFPNDEIMIGYIPDETRDYDEFFLCLTTVAEALVIEINEAEELKQQARLENTINKRVGKWNGFGSDNEIDQEKLKPTRGFIRIEFEARYPIISPVVRFRPRLVHQARDGYVELRLLPRYVVPYLNRRRIDNATQVAPTQVTHIAQTFCAYPKNAWTQYEYACEYQDKFTKEFMAQFNHFVVTHIDYINDSLYVNEDIDFYSSDYTDLCSKSIPTMFDTVHQEYQSFSDVKKCKDKMISAFVWHPMWTGIVAIAYANISPKWYQFQNPNRNVMEEVVHGYNPVLLWSFNDPLCPKLILETNSEVHCLSFCPQDENLLVGGCANGQIILWDIKNKLNKVETEEVLTSAQQAYRSRLFAEMSWMKNTRDYSIVPPTAYSELTNSHMNNVTAIQWIHPLYRIARTGRIGTLEEEDEWPSLQFATSSADGSVKFWDLRQTPMVIGDYKPQRKSRRLGKRPSALTMDVSPYRILNRRMVPLFQVNATMPITERRCPLASIAMIHPNIMYEESFPDPNRVFNITDRIMFEPNYEWPEEPITPMVVCGTYNGDIMYTKWDGYEYTSGDLYSKEDLKIVSIARYHDGPVLTCVQHPKISYTYLSVGGKIFCIWYEKLQKPILWRRSRYKYTHGNWEPNKSFAFHLTTSDGTRECWDLDFKSDGPYSTRDYSGKPLMEGAMHPLPIKTSIVGLADDRGTLRLIYSGHVRVEKEHSVRGFQAFLQSNAQRQADFEDWQTKWTDKHASWIKEQHEAEIAEANRLRMEALERQQYEEEMRAREAAEEAKREAAKRHAPPGMYEEWARERWINKEQERMNNELLLNKRLDKDTLMRQQLPLKKLEVEAVRKQQKIRQRLLKSDEIFNETIAMLFPNLLEKKADNQFQVVTYSPSEINTLNEQFLQAYEDIVVDDTTYIKEHPFTFEFDWKKIFAATKTRTLKNKFMHIERHSDRYRKTKMSVREEPVEMKVRMHIREESSSRSDEVEGIDSSLDPSDTYAD